MESLITERRQDYRTAHITESFDWAAILDTVTEASEHRNLDKMYLVVFRSMRKHSLSRAVAQEISRLDSAAHAEALGSKALLHYFAGDVDAEGRALSWCLWTNSTAARNALSGDDHKKAAQQAPKFYENFGIELYDVWRYSDPVLFIPAERPAHPH